MDNKSTDNIDVQSNFKEEESVILETEAVSLIEERDNGDETEALLPSRRGGLSKKASKPHLKVQWNDDGGNLLAEVLEFQPSDVSDPEEEDSDSCYCAIM